MRDEDIHIGDMLRVREWDDMQREFGTIVAQGAEAIHTRAWAFIDTMFPLCGKVFTVRKVVPTTSALCYRSEENEEGGYMITAEMLEPAYIPEESPEDNLPNIDLTDFLE